MRPELGARGRRSGRLHSWLEVLRAGLTTSRPAPLLSRLARVGSEGWIPVLATGIAAGLALRIWILGSSLGALDGDEAVVGLMARRLLRGEFHVFFLGQSYGGSQEVLLAASVFAVVGSGRLSLKVVTLSLYVVAALLTWRAGRRVVGERAARVGAVLLWVWPTYLVFWSTKSLPTYGFGLVSALLVFLFALRLSERHSRLDAAALGFAAGLGLWATPQIFLLGLPVVGWLVWRRPRSLRLAWLAVPGFLAGASPWLAWNAANGWASLHAKAVAGAGTTYFDRLENLFRFALPMWLGLRVPFSGEWLVGRPAGIALLALALAGLAYLFVRRPAGLAPLLLTAAALPFLYASSSYTYYTKEPRYLVLAAPVPALLLGRALARSPRMAAAGLSAAVGLSIAGLVIVKRDGLFTPPAPDVRVPADISPGIKLLERAGANRVIADYQLAYRISFESRERVIATTTGFVRSLHDNDLVRRSSFPAYLFVRGAKAEREAGGLAQGYRRLETGDFVAYVHPRPRSTR